MKSVKIMLRVIQRASVNVGGRQDCWEEKERHRCRDWFPQSTSQNHSLALGMGYSTTHRVHMHAHVTCVHVCLHMHAFARVLCAHVLVLCRHVHVCVCTCKCLHVHMCVHACKTQAHTHCRVNQGVCPHWPLLLRPSFTPLLFIYPY